MNHLYYLICGLLIVISLCACTDIDPVNSIAKPEASLKTNNAFERLSKLRAMPELAAQTDSALDSFAQMFIKGDASKQEVIDSILYRLNKKDHQKYMAKIYDYGLQECKDEPCRVKGKMRGEIMNALLASNQYDRSLMRLDSAEHELVFLQFEQSGVADSIRNAYAKNFGRD